MSTLNLSPNQNKQSQNKGNKRKRAVRFVRTRQSDAAIIPTTLQDDEQYSDENKKIFTSLTNGDMKLVKRTSKRGKPTKSKCWHLFRLIMNCNTNTLVHDRVFCVGCVKLFHYKLSYGTHSLITHSEQHVRRNWNEAPKSVIEEVKSKMINLMVNYCAKNLRPFSIALDEGLHDLIRECIEMGSVYGTTLPTRYIIPHPTTISRSVIKIADAKRAEMKDFMMKCHRQGMAMSVDGWTEDYTKRKFLGMCFYYIKDMSMECRVLCCREVSETSMTNEVVTKYIETELNKYCITDLSTIIFVTDRGPSLVAAIPKSNRENCVNHVISNIVEHALDLKDMPEWTSLHTKSKLLVTYMKQTALQSQLSITLKQENETRWNSTLKMLKSIQTSWNEVEELLTIRNETNRLDVLNRDLMDTIIKFLTPFHDATLDMEASKFPTIHMVFLWRRKLLKHLAIQERDDSIIRKMKEQAKRYLLNNWITKDIHKVAVFLHPLLRNLIKLSDNPEADAYTDESENIKELIRSKINSERIVDD